MKRFDVVVVGAGPAGSVAAYGLARHGVHTALVEKRKLPRYKTCGGGITFRARQLFPVDIGPVVEREFYAADMFFWNDDVHLRATRSDPIISMVMRDRLDHHLVEAGRGIGVEVFEETAVTGVVSGPTSVSIETSSGPLRAAVVIGADGAFSPVAKMAGWTETRHLAPALEAEVTVSADAQREHSQAVRFDIDAVPFGYGWNFPKQEHLSLGVVSSRRGKVNLQAFYRKYLNQIGIAEIVREDRHGFQIPLSPRTDGFARGGVLLVGDAAGFADPVTAEGISNAALSGQLVATAVVDGRLEQTRVARCYERLLQADLLPQLRSARRLAQVLYELSVVRKPVFRWLGQPAADALTDIFMGTRAYPATLGSLVGKSLKRLPSVLLASG